MIRTFVLGLCLAAACPAPPPSGTSSSVDAGAADPCTAACAALAREGCQEGGQECVPACKAVHAQRLTTLPLACWASSSTKQAARACGGVDCR